MSTLELGTLVGLLALVALEPIRRTREWWARSRPVMDGEHRAFLDALGETIR